MIVRIIEANVLGLPIPLLSKSFTSPGSLYLGGDFVNACAEIISCIFNLSPFSIGGNIFKFFELSFSSSSGEPTSTSSFESS